MKERMYKYLKEHPYARLREMVYDFRMPRTSLLDSLWELQKEGRVTRKTIHNNANMEFYDLWYICEKNA